MACARAVLLLASAATLFAGAAGFAQAGNSMAENPTVQYATGMKQVTLKACNPYGCSTTTRNFMVFDPTPVILSAKVGATTVEAGQLVNLTGTGSGQPTLNYTWKVTSLVTVPPTVPPTEIDVPGAGTWWDTTGVTPGTYSVSLHLQNLAGSDDSPPVTVTVVPEVGKDFFTVTPCRLLDTRQTAGPLASGSPLTFIAAGNVLACGIPLGAKALSVNVTVVSPSAAGFLTLYPGNYPAPNASTINFSAGQTRTNNAVLPLSSDGTGSLAAMPFVSGSGKLQLVVDVNGYFM